MFALAGGSEKQTLIKKTEVLHALCGLQSGYFHRCDPNDPQTHPLTATGSKVWDKNEANRTHRLTSLHSAKRICYFVAQYHAHAEVLGFFLPPPFIPSDNTITTRHISCTRSPWSGFITVQHPYETICFIRIVRVTKYADMWQCTVSNPGAWSYRFELKSYRSNQMTHTALKGCGIWCNKFGNMTLTLFFFNSRLHRSDL